MSLLEERATIDKRTVTTGKVSVRTEDGVIIIPVLEEVLVVEKRLVLKREIRIRTRPTSETVASEPPQAPGKRGTPVGLLFRRTSVRRRIRTRCYGFFVSDAGNAQGKWGLLFRRSNFDLPAMSACDFGRDVEA